MSETLSKQSVLKKMNSSL